MSDTAVYIKAILAAVIGGLGSLSTALTDGDVTGSEFAGILSVTLVALSVVWAVPNKAPSEPLGKTGPSDPRQ